RGRPGLTAERFVPDPFASSPGARLYRSGDRARLLPDGTIEILGRLDRQLKVRGYRVEPDEIEAALREHPAVVQAVAIVAGDGPRLVACVVPAPGAPLAASEARSLRAFLRTRLPEPMLPAGFLSLPELPLTPTGKIDISALAALCDAGDGVAAEPPADAPPGTPVEIALAGLWRELLGATEIGVGDSFFDLGGHSLQGIRLISRIRDQWGIELPVRALFAAPTLGGLAQEIARHLVQQNGEEGARGGAAATISSQRLALLAARLKERRRGGEGEIRR